MKTAEEYIKEILGFDLDAHTTSLVVSRFKSYAKQVAEQALEDAAERLNEKFADYEGFRLDLEECILSTPIVTP